VDVLKHEVRNSSEEDVFVFFELSTMRYRLKPGESFHFFCPSEHPNDPEQKAAESPPLITEFVGQNETIIWINFGMEDGPYLPNGAKAEPDYS
jgi:hypothetical protein